MSFPRLPEMGARMFSAAQAFLGSCSFPCYASSVHLAQANVGNCLPRRKQDFRGPPMNFLLVKAPKYEEKQIDFSEESLNK